MNDIDFLEHGGPGFALLHRGQVINLPDPRQMHFQEVLIALYLGRVPETPGDVEYWKHELVFDRWRASWDLPEFNRARRLSYLVDHYRGALANDLLIHAGLDLGEEWRARRWVRLLDVLDHLPSHSHFNAALANDVEYAEMLAKAAAERGETKPKDNGDGPPLTTWTPEVAVLTQVLDAVNRVAWTTIAAQVGKKAGDAPKPAARPQTALEKAFRKAEYARRQAAHEALVARVLPKKRSVKP